jgi:putative transposase
MEEYKEFYRRKLPHLHTIGSTLFVTFRLANSVPKSVLQRYSKEKEQIHHKESRVSAGLAQEEWVSFNRDWFRRFEELLDKGVDGPMWLGQREIASLVLDGFLRRDKDQIRSLGTLYNGQPRTFRF